VLITQHLWYALNHPPHANRLFQQIMRYAPQPRSPRRPRLSPRRLMAAGVFLLVVLFVIDLLIPFSFATFFIAFGIPGITLVIIIAYGTVNGIQWTLRVSNAIIREHTSGMYDLLCLLPYGEAGANWALCAAHLHRNGGLQTTHEKRGWMMPLAVTMILFSVFVLVGRDVDRADLDAESSGLILLILTVVNFVALTSILLIDYIQSLILAALIGILVPTYTRNHFDTPVAALGSFIALQFGTYLLTVLLAFIVLPQLFIALQWTQWPASLAIAILRPVIFLLLRDILLQLLWVLLAYRLRIAPHELHDITRMVI